MSDLRAFAREHLVKTVTVTIQEVDYDLEMRIPVGLSADRFRTQLVELFVNFESFQATIKVHAPNGNIQEADLDSESGAVLKNAMDSFMNSFYAFMHEWVPRVYPNFADASTDEIDVVLEHSDRFNSPIFLELLKLIKSVEETEDVSDLPF